MCDDYQRAVVILLRGGCTAVASREFEKDSNTKVKLSNGRKEGKRL